MVNVLSDQVSSCGVEDSVNDVLFKPILHSERVIVGFHNDEVAEQRSSQILPLYPIRNQTRLRQIVTVADSDQVFTQLRTHKQIDTLFVEYSVHISFLVAQVMTHLEYLCVPLESEFLHLSGSFNLLGTVGAEGLLLEHCQHVRFVLQLHGHF